MNKNKPGYKDKSQLWTWKFFIFIEKQSIGNCPSNESEVQFNHHLAELCNLTSILFFLHIK